MEEPRKKKIFALDLDRYLIEAGPKTDPLLKPPRAKAEIKIPQGTLERFGATVAKEGKGAPQQVTIRGKETDALSNLVKKRPVSTNFGNYDLKVAVNFEGGSLKIEEERAIAAERQRLKEENAAKKAKKRKGADSQLY